MMVLLNTSTNVPILLTSACGSVKILYRKYVLEFHMLLPKLRTPYYLVRFCCNESFSSIEFTIFTDFIL